MNHSRLRLAISSDRTKMRRDSQSSLLSFVCASGHPGCRLQGAAIAFDVRELAHVSTLGRGADEFRGRSVLIVAKDQLNAGLALIELDGIARRIVLCPPDLPFEYLPLVARFAEADTLVSDESPLDEFPLSIECRVACGLRVARTVDDSAPHQTEWVLLTSGTTGVPKLVVHTLDSLGGAIEPGGVLSDGVVWSTFYDLRRYGGLQIFLRALLTGTPLMVAGAQESTAEFLTRATACGVTHISGTPSHWRRALMSSAAAAFQPRYVRLSGEIADQAILNQLQSFYPQATVVHAFASTEAGVAFEVDDGQEGFPASFLQRNSAVELWIEDGSLRIRSNRIANRYLGPDARPLTGSNGFVDTGDMVVLSGNRCYFAGRRDGMINVGGLKVHPEEVEAVINRHPAVRMALVRTRRNPITGALVVADVVLKLDQQAAAEYAGELEQDIRRLCRDTLPAHKVPAVINFVSALAVADNGKVMRYA